MSDPTPIGKLKRSHLLHYIDASFSDNTAAGWTPQWFLIGKDVEDMSVELNPNISTLKNILDETVAIDNGYEPSVSADTYYANTGDSIYSTLKNIAMNRLTGDDCKTTVMEVVIDTVEGLTTGASSAWIEDCIVKPQSYGGAQGGVNIPYNINFDGNRKTGTVTFTNKSPTFVETT